MAFDDELKFESALVSLLTNNCGWEKEVIKNPTEEDLIKNWAQILFDNNKEKDILNNCPLTDGEIAQILTQVNTLKTPVALNGFINGKTVSITRDNVNDTLHFGKIVSLKIYDRLEIAGGKSRYQIVEQPIFKTNNQVYPSRRGDIMLLINGMPVFHIELKKTGIPISQATTQIEKYMFNGVYKGIFSLVQIFVAMSPEESVYFANPGPDGKFNKDFFFHWEDFNNNLVNDWKDFAIAVLSIPMAHEMVGFYTISDDTDGVLKIMRSYQYYAASRISDKVALTNWTKENQHGGYIWHTTGSGKTMTSFKAAQLIANSKLADKVVFLLDRVELGIQSLINYRNFADVSEEIQSTEDTRILESKLKSPFSDDTLIVTSIQKMSRIKEDSNLKLKDLEMMKQKRIVFIIDECHRSQIGKMHQDIKDTFPNAIYFGFTGTPDHDFTPDIFGNELHRYTLYHGIRDKNVLGFDPIMVNTFDEKELRTVIGLENCRAKTVEEAISSDEKRNKFLYFMNKTDKKCSMIEIEKYIPKSQYETDKHEKAVVSDIIDNWIIRSLNSKFHAIFATSSIPEAIKYYNIFKSKNSNLKITAVFDPNDDNSENSIEKIVGVTQILTDYKEMFGNEYTIGSYDKFKKDVCLRLAHKKPYLNIHKNPSEQINIVIVVNQLLTGFDSKWINTIYLDKELEGKNFIQAISRTNRLYGPDKPHGTVVWYRYPFTMRVKLAEALREYSGEIPTGIYVNKLDINIQNMNLKYKEITDLFNSVGIYSFEKNYEDVAWKKKFAKLFMELNQYLLSAKIQGFRWNQLEYEFKNSEDKLVNIKSDIDEKTYLTLVQRYKELFTYTSFGDGVLPYDIDTHITEISTDSIDDDYMDSKFKMYIKELKNGDANTIEKAIEELHKTFATLSSDEQKYAKLFLHDIESGSIVVPEGKTFKEYIIEYQCKMYDEKLHQFSTGLGIDEAKLKKLISLKLNSNNFNEYGRYDDLINGIDIEKAKAYFENRDSTELTYRETRIIADKELRKIIINNNFYN